MIVHTPASYLRARFLLAARLLEFAVQITREEAQVEAARMASALAMDMRYHWPDLREALEDRPALAALVPEKYAPVDSLPFGEPSFVLRGQGIAQLNPPVPRPLIFPGPPS